MAHELRKGKGMTPQTLSSIPPNILIGVVLLFVLLGVVGSLTIGLLRATKRDKMIKLLRERTMRRRDVTKSLLLSSKNRVRRVSNRADLKPFDLVNPAAIKRDLRRAGLPQVWPLVFVAGVGLAFLVGFTILNAPLDTFPPWMQSVAIIWPCFYFVRRPLLNTFVERRRMIMSRQLILFVETAQRAVTVGASPEEAVLEAIRDAEKPLRQAVEPIRALLDLGYDFIEALAMSADQINLAEFDIFVASLSAQSTTGGSIGDVLKEVVDISRSRLDLLKRVGTMTAEGRFNALLLGSMPIALMTYLRISQPEYFGYLWTSPFIGSIIFFGTIAGAVIGAFVAVRIANIKV